MALNCATLTEDKVSKQYMGEMWMKNRPKPLKSNKRKVEIVKESTLN